MRVVLGIYQEKEKIDSYLTSHGINAQDSCQIGPFTSKNQAMEWMDYLETRLSPRPVERLIVDHPTPEIWYGTVLTLEQRRE